MWCVAKLDEEYIERMENILRLYNKPLNSNEPVVCFDEKSVQLLSDLYAPQLPQPGKILRRDHEYVRCGTVNVFCSVEPKAGRHFLKVTKRRTALDFADVLRDIEHRYADADVIHLVLDNLNTHRLKSLTSRFGEIEGTRLWRRFSFHFTPKHASWLNQAEIQISAFARAVVRRSRLPSPAALRAATKAWQRKMNKLMRPFSWTFNVPKARKVFNYDKN
jgi:hypothetical protein